MMKLHAQSAHSGADPSSRATGRGVVPNLQPQWSSLLKSGVLTLVIVVAYGVVMASTNGHFTLLDDESIIIAFAGNNTSYYIHNFLSGQAANEHPPLSDLLLHLWLLATNYSFSMLRVFANLFYIAGVLFTALATRRISGRSGYRITLVLGFLWPFAFQYGRITGWYCFCMFMVACLTWSYLKILDDQDYWAWVSFGIAAVALVWSNYFGVALLSIFLADLILFHRKLIAARLRLFMVTVTVVAFCFLPLLEVALSDQQTHSSSLVSVFDPKNALVSFGYPVFSIFASVAVAPWYLPLSIPVFVGVVLLAVSIWHSPGRRWFLYLVFAIALLQFSGHLTIKRVIFLFPWLFMAMAIALTSRESRHPRLATAAVVILLISGWVGILSGRHYATTNLYEPWGKVASVVADDARQGATIISVNPPFFLYLDYQLGLQSATQGATGPYLQEETYRSHGYSILLPTNWQTWEENLHGKVVLVDGSGVLELVNDENALNDALRKRCSTVGEYHAAPDPAAMWKVRFAKNVPVLANRTNVFWYDCPR